MRKALIIASLLFMIPAATSLAVPINITLTADNVIKAWFKDGGTPGSLTFPADPDASLSNWKVSDTFTIDLASGHDWELIFQTENIGTAGTGNPGGFLAEIDYGPIYSDPSWQVAVLYGSDSNQMPLPSDWSTLTWEAARSYGYNGQSGIIWTNVLGGPVTGISSNAYWIWDDLNFAETGAPDQYDSVFFKVTFHVPEPPTLLLLGAGFVCVAGFGRRRLLKKN